MNVSTSVEIWAALHEPLHLARTKILFLLGFNRVSMPKILNVSDFTYVSRFITLVSLPPAVLPELVCVGVQTWLTNFWLAIQGLRLYKSGHTADPLMDQASYLGRFST